MLVSIHVLTSAVILLSHESVIGISILSPSKIIVRIPMSLERKKRQDKCGVVYL